jgi:long-chain acyl-CoA synthetase
MRSSFSKDRSVTAHRLAPGTFRRILGFARPYRRQLAGFLTLVGRKHDLIITSGFNVYPQVVERVINDCPGVKESAVLGQPDDRRGERVTAVIVRDDPALDERRVKAHCAEHLVDYQRPAAVVFVDALPRNALGKVLRRELRDRLAGGG